MTNAGRFLTHLTLTLGLIAFGGAGCSDDGSNDETAGTGGTAGSGGSGAMGGGSGAGGAPTVSEDELLNLGPFDVGFREMSLSYTPPASDEVRELSLRIWYPAAPDSGAEQAVYEVVGVVAVPTDVALDAPPIADGTGFPLALYSHGSGGQALLGYPYGELMASHGWILASANHAGNTALDDLSGNSAPSARTRLNRPSDVTALIDWLESGLVEDDLSGKADTSSVFVIGHSFGAYTAFTAGGATPDYDTLTENCDDENPSESCQIYADPEVEAAFRAGLSDPRVAAIAPQAPGVPPGGDLAGLDVPTMLMSGLLDRTTPHAVTAVPAWEALDGPDDIWVDMPRGAHFTFITICHDLSDALINVVQPDAFEDGCDFELSPPTDEVVPILAAYVLGFARLHILGESEWENILRGPTIGEFDDEFEITLPQ
ncbi:MAG: hypothetical protein AAF997_17990 [Myxococcota bacterium]